LDQKAKKRGFSLYDIEEFLREAGAEKVHESALLSFEKELESTVDELVNEAILYDNYAGRRKVIKYSDVEMVKECNKSLNKAVILNNVMPRAKMHKRHLNRIRAKALGLSAEKQGLQNLPL
jgi:histone H3/H4